MGMLIFYLIIIILLVKAIKQIALNIKIRNINRDNDLMDSLYEKPKKRFPISSSLFYNIIKINKFHY